MTRSSLGQFEHVVSASKTIQPEALINVVNTDEPGRLADVITPYLRQMRVDAQQEILETEDVGERLQKLAGERNEAVARFNDLAGKYNGLVKDLNEARAKLAGGH